MNAEAIKASLALAHHLADLGLDLTNAPRKYRVVVALVGVAWAAAWLAYYSAREQADRVQTDEEKLLGPRVFITRTKGNAKKFRLR